MYPANCFVITIPKSDVEWMSSEKLSYQHQNNLIQAYIDTLFQPGVNEFDKWRWSLNDFQLEEILSKNQTQKHDTETIPSLL